MMLVRFIALISAVLVFCPALTMAQTTTYPKVSFDYSSSFDATCTELAKQPVEPEAVKEMEERIDSFREHWRKDAPQFFGTTLKLTGVPFEFRETRAALHLCRGFSSMSNPLLISVRYFIRAIEGKQAGSMPQFSGLIFHETLHRYVSDWVKTMPDKTTPLLTKYREEPSAVRYHLHLFAIMNEVYRKLERQKDLESILAYEQTVSKFAPILKRAREIVDKEGAESFIREFRKNRQGV